MKTIIFEVLPKNPFLSLLLFFFQKKYWVIEPFHAYHHSSYRRIGFSPSRHSGRIEKVIKKKEISIVHSQIFSPLELCYNSGEKAVEVIEKVFPKYRKRHAILFDFAVKTVGSEDAEYVYKKYLCDRLAVYYSANSFFHRLTIQFPKTPILVYPSVNLALYHELRSFLEEVGEAGHKHPSIHFPLTAIIFAKVRIFFDFLKSVCEVIAQVLGSCIASSRGGKVKRSCRFAVSIVSERQLYDNMRGPSFIIDGKNILPNDVVYIPLIHLTSHQKEKMQNVFRGGERIFFLPPPGRFFSDPKVWLRFFITILRSRAISRGSEIRSTASVIFFYLQWKYVLGSIAFDHFITHADFLSNHIGRNIALHQAGIQTWYYMDSMNFGCNFSTGKSLFRQPAWAYMLYRHRIVWDDFLSDYFQGHPGSGGIYHTTGCLWSGHSMLHKEEKNTKGHYWEGNRQSTLTIAVFDTTYTINGMTSYAEGLAFAHHIFRLTHAHSSVLILWKEKKKRQFHKSIGSIDSAALPRLYDEMNIHPRIRFFSPEYDSSELMACSDFVISFPFTSTTFETLSTNRPAIWHDPCGYYRDTPYAKIGGVTTHSYEELEKKVIEIKNMDPRKWQNPIPPESPLLDPYRDGKAIDRFRDLLINS